MKDYIICKPVILPKSGDQKADRYLSICILHKDTAFTSMGDLYKNPDKLVLGLRDASEAWNMTAKTLCAGGGIWWNGLLQPHHLYLVSDEVPVEGDYIIRKDMIIHLKQVIIPWDKKESVVKATTDKSLGLPLIPQSFVQEYAQKQGKINKVRIRLIKGMVVVNINDQGNYNGFTGFIEILPIKDSWNREEVREVARLAQNRSAYMSFDEWFDKNY